jgi:hypothetical protein
MQVLRLLLVAQAAFGAIVAQRQSNSACDSKYMESFKKAFALESSMWATTNFKDDPFYTTPENASDANPGDLLRWQDLSIEQMANNWTGIPAGTWHKICRRPSRPGMLS